MCLPPDDPAVWTLLGLEVAFPGHLLDQQRGHTLRRRREPGLTFNWHHRWLFNGRRNGPLFGHRGFGQAPQGTQWGRGGEFGAFGEASQPRGTRQGRRSVALALRGQARRGRLQQGGRGLGLVGLALRAQSNEVSRRRVACGEGRRKSMTSSRGRWERGPHAPHCRDCMRTREASIQPRVSASTARQRPARASSRGDSNSAVLKSNTRSCNRTAGQGTGSVSPSRRVATRPGWPSGARACASYPRDAASEGPAG